MNWKCRIFGHKLKDISNGENMVNVGICEREGTLHKLEKRKPMHVIWPRP